MPWQWRLIKLTKFKQQCVKLRIWNNDLAWIAGRGHFDIMEDMDVRQGLSNLYPLQPKISATFLTLCRWQKIFENIYPEWKFAIACHTGTILIAAASGGIVG